MIKKVIKEEMEKRNLQRRKLENIIRKEIRKIKR
jgi:hypothetical protein